MLASLNQDQTRWMCVYIKSCTNLVILFFFSSVVHRAKSSGFFFVLFCFVWGGARETPVFLRLFFKSHSEKTKQESFLFLVEYGIEWRIFVGEGERRPMTQFHKHAQTHTHTHTHTHTQRHLTWSGCNYGFRYLYFCLCEINSKNHGINSIYFCSFYLLTCTLHSNLAPQDSF